MKYKYLREWKDKTKFKRYKFKKLYKFEDQFVIKFFKEKKYLQINFASEESFIFFTNRKDLKLEDNSQFDLTNRLLRSSFLERVEISDKDRIVNLIFTKVDMYNQHREFSLIIELIPRYQNFILAEEVEESKEKFNKILDCWKKISFTENSERQILPGLEYKKPPPGFENEDSQVKYPLSLNKRKIVENSEEGYEDINEFLDFFYYENILDDRMEKLKQQRIKSFKKKIKKKKKKIKKLEKEFNSAKKEKEWKQKAELLKASFNKIKKGMTEIELINYYEEPYDEKMKIKLFDDKYPKQNVDYYFKKYKKSKRGKKIIKKQIIKTYDEINDLESDIFDIQEIDNYFDIKRREPKKKKKKKSSRKPYRKIEINDNWCILIGKTSKDNDKLTMKIANKKDLWFHTRVFKGTHVILRNKKNKNEIPTKLKLICAALGAYFSKAQKSSNIPVDCTEKRYVRKPKGSPPGFVIYDHQKTLWVNPVSIREAKIRLEKMFN